MAEEKLVYNFKVVWDHLFLNRGITLAICNSSGKMPVFNTWLINKVSGLIIAGSMILINVEEIPSSPQLFFEGRFCIVFLTVSSSMV